MCSRYLTTIERRLHSLESLISQRLPDVNIDEALATFRSDDEPNKSPSQSSFSALSPNAGTPVDIVDLASPSTISEAVPVEADGFDWQEDVNELADGMAALSVEPKGTGYLGKMCLWRKSSTHLTDN